MNKLTAVLLLIAGVILFLPVTGVFGAARLSSLYGLAFDEPNLLILMRHRAVLMGMLGGFICYAAFRPTWQPLALVAGLIYSLAFLWLAYATGGYNLFLQRIVLADFIALGCLLTALALHLFNRKA
jgi:hypothetical protein